jgi:hypothetical protein
MLPAGKVCIWWYRGVTYASCARTRQRFVRCSRLGLTNCASTELKLWSKIRFLQTQRDTRKGARG